MKSKETKINIEVNIYGSRFSVPVTYAEQDMVRATESEMKAYLKNLRDRHSTKTVTECMAMMAFHYARNYLAMKAQMIADATEAEELLRDACRICGEEESSPETWVDGGLFGSGEY